MRVDAAHAAMSNGDGEGGASASGRAELFCLLRLHEIALADPPPVDGLRAMVDEIVRLPTIFRALATVPEGGADRMRYLAHVGLRGMHPHGPLLRTPAAMATKALHTGELVQLMRSEAGSAHACINVPIRGGDRTLGCLGLGMHLALPLAPWREEMAWAMADLMALSLLNYRSQRPSQQGTEDTRLGGLTPRQREVLYELVERGAGNVEIGERFGLSARTIKIHLMAAYRHLGVRGRADAIRMVLTEHGDWLAQERTSRRQRADVV